MKKGWKRAAMGAIFIAAVNINGCVYGPGGMENATTVTPTTTATPADSARVEEPVTDELLLLSEALESDAT